MIKKLLILFLLFPFMINAQISYNFEDGNISSWTQSLPNKWSITSKNPLKGLMSLQHTYNNPKAGRDQISIPLSLSDFTACNITWRFIIKHAYNPSSANNWGVFLANDSDAQQMHPSGISNGFVIGVNYKGSDDTLKIWKVKNGTEKIILTTKINWQTDITTKKAPAIEINKDWQGNWIVRLNSESNFSDLAVVGTANDVSSIAANYFGISFKYSASQDQKLWIDNVSVVSSDDNKPSVLEFNIVSAKQLMLRYSEQVDSLVATNTNNYTLNNNIGNPDFITIKDENREVSLHFLLELTTNNYILSIRNIVDINNNKINDTSLNFSFYQLNPYDIVINEIMADPNPSIKLPEQEYIELYNTTKFNIDISDWLITIGKKTKILPKTTICAKDYIVLCDKDAASELKPFGNIIGINGFPSLVNTGQTISLQNNSGKIISSISYSDKWYYDNYKKEGGWSLEQIDPLNPCGNENNWTASNNKSGGTPGEENSVNAKNPDNELPQLLRASIIKSNELQLIFNEKINTYSAQDNTIYSVDNNIGNPDSVGVISPADKRVILKFNTNFNSNTIYNLKIKDNILDCVGNKINESDITQFAIPLTVEPNDIVINEVLFNPYSGGKDFVEIYNRSDKIIDLKTLFIGGYDNKTSEYKKIKQISAENYLSFPGEYHVLTKDIENIKSLYHTDNPNNFIEIPYLVSFNSDQGRIILFDKTLNIIDDFEYTEKMHYPLLVNEKGISLERINYNRPTNDKTNWHSASELSGFATPAYKNSQFTESEKIKNEINIKPKVFSPNNDGFDDITNISFNLGKPGYVTNIKIYDTRGRLIRYLANNLLLGVNPTISWDGFDDNKNKAIVGIYVIYIQLFDLTGNVKEYKKSIVVAT
ncbi:MAG: lamin tail domain-containing protein [Bacteroidales bacterium]|nr:lamin tail domain-containing protein [Bacteroidales bacterium]